MDLDFTVADLPIYPGGWAYDWFATPASRANYWAGVHGDRLDGKVRLPILGLSGTTEDRKQQLWRYFTDEGSIVVYRQDLVGIALSHEQDGGRDHQENELYDYIKMNWPEVTVYKFYSYPLMPYSIWTDGIAEKCDGYVYDDYFNRDPTVFRRRVMRFVLTGKPLVEIIWATEPGWGGYWMDDWIDGLPADQQNGMVINAPNSHLEQYFWLASSLLREFGLPVALFGITGSGSVNNWYNGYSETLANSPNHHHLVADMAFLLKTQMRATAGGPEPSADEAFSQGIEVDSGGGSFAYTDSFQSRGIYLGLGTVDDASIHGFTKLRQLPDVNGTLVTCDDNELAGQVELVYRFYVTSGGLGSVTANLSGSVRSGQGGCNRLGLSLDGVDCLDWVESTPAYDGIETLVITGDADLSNLPEFYIHVRMDYARSMQGAPANQIFQLDVAAVPCEPYDSVSNLDRDCDVDSADLALFAAHWLETPHVPHQLGDLDGDGDIDILDFAIFSADF